MHFRKLVGLAAIISALTVAGAANGDSATWDDPSGCVLEARANLCPAPVRMDLTIAQRRGDVCSCQHCQRGLDNCFQRKPPWQGYSQYDCQESFNACMNKCHFLCTGRYPGELE
jgi:hypothetical protein